MVSKENRNEVIEKDCLINHFTLECNNCKCKSDVLINLDEDFFQEIKFDCFKCGNTFTINLNGFNQGSLSKEKEMQLKIDELVKQKQDIIRKEGYPASDIIAVLRREIKKEMLDKFEKMIDELASKVKAREVDIGEYDKFISVHDLKQNLKGDK